MAKRLTVERRAKVGCMVFVLEVCGRARVLHFAGGKESTRWLGVCRLSRVVEGVAGVLMYISKAIAPS
jgi:hypothetical protein